MPLHGRITSNGPNAGTEKPMCRGFVGGHKMGWGLVGRGWALRQEGSEWHQRGRGRGTRRMRFTAECLAALLWA